MSDHRKKLSSGDRKFEPPVAWLLGRQLLRSIKGILLYTAYGRRLDPRDWMLANVFPSAERAEALRAWRERRFEPAAGRALLDEELAFWQKRGEFWFDYISDTGDGMKATYSIAYLCLSDLYVESLNPERLAAGAAARTGVNEDGSAAAVLPRGEFLFVGGDTAYHVSNYMTLANRVQRPFRWAYKDLEAEGGVSGEEPNRPLIGIPGNHDYYDQLNGFRRQFRHSVRGEPLRGSAPETTDTSPPSPPSPEDLAKQAQLFLPGFNRHQQASYIALQLPFDWQLWGLDTEVGQIDERQRKFFRDLCPEDPANPGKRVPPGKLIVATCAPTTAFGKLAARDDGKTADAFRQLGLAQPFLPRSAEWARAGEPDLSTTGDAQLEEGQCRLDISGDIHHYARYWGPRPAGGRRPPRDGAETEPPAAESYASVVSGIGGAFHHPSETYLDEIQEQALYPPERDSTREVAQKIFNPWNIVRGGYVWLAGLIMAFTIYFAFTIPQSSRQVINSFPLIKWLDLNAEKAEPITPTAITVPPRLEDFPDTPVTPFWLWYRLAILLDPGHDPTIREWVISGCSGPARFDNPYLYFYGPCAVTWPLDLRIGALLLLASIIPLWTGLTSRRLFRREQEAPADRMPDVYIDPEIYAKPDRWLWPMVAVSALMLTVGALMIKPYRAHITPFGNSLIILYSIIWAAAALALSNRYSEFLFKKSHYDYIHKYNWALTWVLTILGVTSIALGLSWFGGNNLPVLLVSDMVFILVLVGGLVALLLLPYEAGAHLFQPRRRSVNRSRAAIWGYKFLIGLWHAVLQILTPLILIRKGTYQAWAAAAVLIFIFSWFGASLLKRSRRGLLVLVWVLYGGSMLALPYLTVWLLGLGGPVFPEEWNGWWGPLPLELVPPLAAGAAGAFLSCVWLGWYLAVCFAFNGHNNEVGGAARIERFKQFIRFRLTPDGLTGYVIGIDDPQEHGRDLRPKIVDVFHLKVKSATK